MEPRSDGETLPLFTSLFADKSLAAPRPGLVEPPKDDSAYHKTHLNGGKTNRPDAHDNDPIGSASRREMRASTMEKPVQQQPLGAQYPVTEQRRSSTGRVPFENITVVDSPMARCDRAQQWIRYPVTEKVTVIDSTTAQPSVREASVREALVCRTSGVAGDSSSRLRRLLHPYSHMSHQPRPRHVFFPPRTFSRTEEGPVDGGGGGGGREVPDCFELSSDDNGGDDADEEEDDDDSGGGGDGDGDGHPDDVACELSHAATRAPDLDPSSEGTSRGSRDSRDSRNNRGEPHESRKPPGDDLPHSGYGMKLTLHSMLPSYYSPAIARQSTNRENGIPLGSLKPAAPEARFSAQPAARFSAQPAAHLQRASDENDSSDDDEGEEEGRDDEDAEEEAFNSPRKLHVSSSRRPGDGAPRDPRCELGAANFPFRSPSPSPSPPAASAQSPPASSKPTKIMRKSKLRLTPSQVQVLESHFTEIEREIKLETRLKLASQLRLKPRQVAVWFQNRRVKHATLMREGELARLRAELAQAHAELAELRKENERTKREMGNLAEEHAELKSKYDALLPRSSKRKSPENESMSAPPQKRVKEEILEYHHASAGCAEHTDARPRGELIPPAAEFGSGQHVESIRYSHTPCKHIQDASKPSSASETGSSQATCPPHPFFDPHSNNSLPSLPAFPPCNLLPSLSHLISYP
ncbi:unnamed protein product [Closterium sp. Yama58-4]|nr:unnamed protein product [Closterium sp. Yama58-4]